jgi:hypothetical protein
MLKKYAAFTAGTVLKFGTNKKLLKIPRTAKKYPAHFTHAPKFNNLQI